MIRRPNIRRVSLVATSSLLALMLVGPGTAGAATPLGEAASHAVPAVIKAGETGAFVTSFHNGDKSTISQLFLSGTLTGTGVALVAAYPSQGTCDGLDCTFGQLKPRKDVTVTVVYSTTTATLAAAGSFVYNTVGLGSGSGDASHGDQWTTAASSSTRADGNYGGRFINNSNLVVANDQAINDANPHATKVLAPKTFIGVTVSDGSVVTQPCAAPIVCADLALFGESSVINVADGGSFPGGFNIIISFDSSEVVGANQNTLSIYHTYTGGAELIDQRCAFAKNSTTPKSMPCLTVSKSGPDLIASIWTTHNGIMRGNA